MKPIRLLASFPSAGLVRKFCGSAFISDRKGATAIEFAMIFAPFIGLIFAIFQAGMVYFQSSQLQQATEVAARAVLTHTTAASMTYQQFVTTYVCPHLSGFDCSKLRVSITSASNWTSSNVAIGTAASFYDPTVAQTSLVTMPAASTSTTPVIAVVRIAYPIPPITAILTGGGLTAAGNTGHAGQTKLADGTFATLIMGVYAFRVEP